MTECPLGVRRRPTCPEFVLGFERSSVNLFEGICTYSVNLDGIDYFNYELSHELWTKISSDGCNNIRDCLDAKCSKFFDKQLTSTRYVP